MSGALVPTDRGGDLPADVRPGSGAMFDRIAERYDFLNRVLSMGIDRRWRKRLLDRAGMDRGLRVLDLATGTGDLALASARRGASVVGLDPSTKMLEVAARKAERAGLSQIEWVVGDAEELPHADASFDRVTIAFGIRNVPDRPRALAEMRRVLKPGGLALILELSEPRGFMGPLARFHVHTVVPRLGAWLSGAAEYRYLEKSIARFPAPEVFAETIRGAGLIVDDVTPLTFGVVCLFVGRKEGAS